MTDLPIMVATAFALGIAARFVRLPPLVGFLIAGFVFVRRWLADGAGAGRAVLPVR